MIKTPYIFCHIKGNPLLAKAVDAFVAAACSFIEKWKRLEPIKKN